MVLDHMPSLNLESEPFKVHTHLQDFSIANVCVFSITFFLLANHTGYLPNPAHVNLSCKSSCIMFCAPDKSITLPAFFHDHLLFCSCKSTFPHVDVNYSSCPSILLS